MKLTRCFADLLFIVCGEFCSYCYRWILHIQVYRGSRLLFAEYVLIEIYCLRYIKQVHPLPSIDKKDDGTHIQLV